VDDLVARARRLLEADRRVVLGLCGAPGSGKSTLAHHLVERLGPQVVTVPMDGFHLQDEELVRLGLLDRKGAPETFDVDGYLALLHRVREGEDRIVYAPSFDRNRELSLAGSIPVLPEHRLVITEGNYLLLDTPPWSQIRRLLDEIWFVEAPEQVRLDRLVARHVEFGRTPADARQRVTVGSDAANARLVAATRSRADLVVES
jgi:pantothenate kinase